MIESVEPAYGYRQLAGVFLGAALMFFLWLADYRWLTSLGWMLYLGGMAFLPAVNGMGAVSGGAARWLEIGSFRFQPSKLGKLRYR